LPDGNEIRNSGGYELVGVTNNHAEITAAINGLKRIYEIATSEDFQDEFSSVLVISDSKYVINQGEKNWRRNKNLELLENFDHWVDHCGFPVNFMWVRGHAGVEENEQVDELAGLEVQMIKAEHIAIEYTNTKEMKHENG